MVHVCMECYEIYENKLLSDKYVELFCPKKECQGEVVELDENIAPTIIELNVKGYHTKFCCGGHWYGSCFSPYIYFHDDCMPDDLPEDFVKCEHSSDTTIRYRLSEHFGRNEKIDKFDESLKVARILRDWVKKLPVVEW